MTRWIIFFVQGSTRFTHRYLGTPRSSYASRAAVDNFYYKLYGGGV